MIIDDKRKHVLTKITKTKNGVVKKESDHHVLITEFNNIVSMDKSKDKIEMYNLKNAACQKKFKEYTSNTKMLSSIFDSKDDLDILAQRFIKKLNGSISKNFRKIRVSTAKKSTQDILYEKMRMLKEKGDESSKKELDKVIDEIANTAEDRYEKIREDLNKMKAEEGKINSQKFWKIKKTMFKKNTDAPAAFNDAHGNLLTSDKAIQDRVLKVVTERLKGNPMEKHLEP